MAQVVRSPKVYDVCIIGSGAAGGTAAKVLTEGGLNVVMLEAGPPLHPEKDFKEHVWPYQLVPSSWRRASAESSSMRWATNSWRPTAPGKSTANPTPQCQGRNFTGSAPGLWAAAPIIGDASLFASPQWISGLAPPTAWAMTGRLPTKKFPLTYDKVESYIGVFGTKENIPSASRRDFSASTPAALHRNHRQEGLRQTEHSLCAFAHGNSDQAAERPRGVPLLCSVRPGLPYRFQLQLQPGNDSAGTSHRAVHLAHGRDGARDCVVGKDGKAEAVAYIDKATRDPRSACMPARSSWQRVPVNPPAYCSIRDPVFFLMAWQIHRGRSAAT